MTRLELHPLPGAKRAAEVADLVAKLQGERRRVVIWVSDEGRMRILDDFLWTSDKLAFLPHAVWAEGVDVTDEPVVLVSRPMNPNRAEVLVVGDGLPPLDWAAGFAEVHDLVAPGEAGEERRAFWRQLPQSGPDEESTE
jgi:DNA polymerase IIIc chi subunit